MTVLATALKFAAVACSLQVSDMAVDFATLTKQEVQQEAAPSFDFSSAQKVESTIDFSSLAQVDANGPDVEQTIREAAKAQGIDETTLLAIASVESGLDPKAKNPRSTAGGLFQFVDDTWKGEGFEGVDKFDPVENSRAGAQFTKKNMDGLEQELGRKPTLEEVYMAHFLGLQGAKDAMKKLQENPDALAKDVFSNAVRKANPNVFKEGVTAKEAIEGLTGKVTAAAKKFAG